MFCLLNWKHFWIIDRMSLSCVEWNANAYVTKCSFYRTANVTLREQWFLFDLLRNFAVLSNFPNTSTVVFPIILCLFRASLLTRVYLLKTIEQWQWSDWTDSFYSIAIVLYEKSTRHMRLLILTFITWILIVSIPVIIMIISIHDRSLMFR